MSPRKRYAFYIDPELESGLKALKARDGANEAESIRRAIADYLKKRGISTEGKTADRPRAVTRKRS